jgi:hypothetical protein
MLTAEQRLAQQEKTLHMGLKCIALMIEDLELATRENADPTERAIARARVIDLVGTMKALR